MNDTDQGNALSGSLGPGVIPRLLRDLYVGRGTGVLHVTREEERRGVRFRKGNIVRAETNIAGDRMGEMLVEQEALSPEDLERAIEVVVRDKRKLGAVLQELGIMDKERLDDALATHAREVLRGLFVWTEGTYAFSEESELPVDGDLSMHLSTGELILEAVAATEDPDVIRRELGDLDRVLALSLDPMLRFQKITLTPADGFLLSRVDGTLSTRQIVELAPMPTEEAERSLFGLICAGVIEQTDESRPAREAEPPATPPQRQSQPQPQAQPQVQPQAQPAKPQTSPSEPPPSPTPAAAVAPTPQPPAAPTPPAPPAREAPARSDATDDAEQARWREQTLELFAGLKRLNHFEILGIARASGEAEVKAAYFQRAREYHPDSQIDAGAADLEREMEAIFIRVGLAYEVLRDRRKRGDYEATLPRAPRTPATTTATTTTPADAARMPESAENAEQPETDRYALAARLSGALEAGRKLYEEEKYWDAVQLLEPFVEQAEVPKMRHKFRILLAQVYAKNPKWGKRAEEEIREVLKEAPNHVEAHFTLATFYANKGLSARANAMFRKVLALDPEHEAARARVARTEASEEKGEKRGKGGLLKKLFRKE